MNFLPISLRITDRKVLMVGGGRVARQKLETLIHFTRRLVVRAPEVVKEIDELGVEINRLPYDPECLDDIGLVFACTNDRAVNRRVVEDARRRGILACSADDPDYSDFISPAILKEDYMSVAVSSDARDVKRAISWRNSVLRLLHRGDLE